MSEIDPKRASPVLLRLIEEIRREQEDADEGDRPADYNRMHNRHNRSTPPGTYNRMHNRHNRS